MPGGGGALPPGAMRSSQGGPRGSNGSRTVRSQDPAAPYRQRMKDSLAASQKTGDFTLLRDWVHEVETGSANGVGVDMTPVLQQKLAPELQAARLVLHEQEAARKLSCSFLYPRRPVRGGTGLPQQPTAPAFAISKNGKGGTRRWAGRAECKAAHFGTERRFGKAAPPNAEPGGTTLRLPPVHKPSARIGREDRTGAPGQNLFASHMALPPSGKEGRARLVRDPLRFVTVVASPHVEQHTADVRAAMAVAAAAAATAAEMNAAGDGNDEVWLPDDLPPRPHPDIVWKGKTLKVQWLLNDETTTTADDDDDCLPPLTHDILVEGDALAVEEVLAKSKLLHALGNGYAAGDREELRKKPVFLPAEGANNLTMLLRKPDQGGRDGKLTFVSVTDGMNGVVTLLAEDGVTEYCFVNPVDRRQYLSGGSPVKVELGYSPGPGPAFVAKNLKGGQRRNETGNGIMKSGSARIGWIADLSARNEKRGWMGLDSCPEHASYDRSYAVPLPGGGGTGQHGPFPRSGKGWTHDPVTGKAKGNGATDGLPCSFSYNIPAGGVRALTGGHGRTAKRGAVGLLSETRKDFLSHEIARGMKGYVPALPLKGMGGELTSMDMMAV